MVSKITEQELFAVLDAIESGDVTIPREQSERASSTIDIHVLYTASNGWRFVIFSDCGSWDYIEQVTAPDGRTMDFDEIYATMLDMEYWRPKNKEPWGI